MALSLGTMLSCSLQAIEVNDWLSVDGVAAFGGQYQWVSGHRPFSDAGRGAFPIQVEATIHPNDTHELFAKLGTAEGNGLNEVSPFNSATWGADLEDDVEAINGRNRDYLLAAHYRLSLDLGNHGLALTGGILDSTDFLDGNLYANDEYNQFMNDLFVNSGSYGLPSYDLGGAIEWTYGDWSVNAIAMNIGANDDGNEFNYWGLQLGRSLETDLGKGNYRLIVVGTDSQFLNPEGTDTERVFAAGISFDQEVSDDVGVFLRMAWQSQDRSNDYRALYSGGLNFDGSAWGREGDNVGVGYAYLPGGNSEIERSHAAEVYYRFVFGKIFAVTADLQYLTDTLEDAPSPHGWVGGIRATVEF